MYAEPRNGWMLAINNTRFWHITSRICEMNDQACSLRLNSNNLKLLPTYIKYLEIVHLKLFLSWELYYKILLIGSSAK